MQLSREARKSLLEPSAVIGKLTVHSAALPEKHGTSVYCVELGCEHVVRPVSWPGASELPGTHLSETYCAPDGTAQGVKPVCVDLVCASIPHPELTHFAGVTHTPAASFASSQSSQVVVRVAESPVESTACHAFGSHGLQQVCPESRQPVRSSSQYSSKYCPAAQPVVVHSASGCASKAVQRGSAVLLEHAACAAADVADASAAARRSISLLLGVVLCVRVPAGVLGPLVYVPGGR